MTKRALRIAHLLVWSNKKLELMAQQAFILTLHFLSINLVFWHIQTFFMVIVELIQTQYLFLTHLFIVGAVELNLELWKNGYKKRTRTSKWTLIVLCSPFWYASHAEYFTTGSVASSGSHAYIKANIALEVLEALLISNKIPCCYDCNGLHVYLKKIL